MSKHFLVFLGVFCLFGSYKAPEILIVYLVTRYAKDNNKEAKECKKGR